jgi:uncharacterized protein (DUF169 family)
MNTIFRNNFLTLWRKYFVSAELPITFEYTNELRSAEQVTADSITHCFIAQLSRVSNGESLAFGAKSFACAGGRYYTGFAQRLRSEIAEFLSCDAKGEGERYKKNPEIAQKVIEQVPWKPAPTTYLLFKRWDKLEAEDNPEVVIFFAVPDVLSGLFTLAGYDEPDIHGAIITPFSSGCGSIVLHPHHEAESDHPRAVLGMFDVSARPHVPSGTLTFAVPMRKFERMVANMDESFLITESWRKILKRLSAK